MLKRVRKVFRLKLATAHRKSSKFLACSAVELFFSVFERGTERAVSIFFSSDSHVGELKKVVEEVVLEHKHRPHATKWLGDTISGN